MPAIKPLLGRIIVLPIPPFLPCATERSSHCLSWFLSLHTDGMSITFVGTSRTSLFLLLLKKLVPKHLGGRADIASLRNSSKYLPFLTSIKLSFKT